MNLRLAMLFVIFIGIAAPVHADEEVQALRAQIKLLEARLDALERKQAQRYAQTSTKRQPATGLVSAPAVVMQPAVLPPSALETRITALEAKTAAVQSKQQASADVSYQYGEGLTVKSPDNRMALKLSGYFQADDRDFLGDSPPGNNDQFLIRSARPILEAKYDRFSARLLVDFGNGATQLLDAYGDYNGAKAFNLRVGKFKQPLGIERWQPEQNVLFVERGMTTNLVPFRDNGVGLYGEIIPSILEYQLAVTDGAPDLVNGTNATDNDQALDGRIFAHPFAQGEDAALKGIGLGLAGSWGDHNGSAANQELTSGYVTPGQSRFFTYAAATYASGEQWRLNPQATYYNGPFGFIGEYVLENQEVKNGARQQVLQNDAWLAIATYVLTGEDARFNGVIPDHYFDPIHGGWGAFELVGRLSRLNVDKDAFPLFASAAASADSAREATAGGTWYMNPNVKLNLNFAFTQFDGGAPKGSRPDEKAVLTRTQVKF